MSTAQALLLLCVVVPFAGALLIPVARRRPNLREGVTLVTAGLLALVVLGLLRAALAGPAPEIATADIVPGVSLGLKVEPLGLLFALVASLLWIVNSIYSIGYMRAGDEPRQTTYYACFAVALASTMGVAFAENLFTMFLFYEVLTLSTYPLVTHRRDAAAMRGGRIYLLLLLGTSMVLFLPAIIATYVATGTLDFSPGGILGGKVTAGGMAVLLALYVFGIGKAAMVPLHFWLPAAMVAPTPVSALLHAVAVVKAGVFTILKVVVYIFGIETLTNAGANRWLIYAASAGLLIASLVALSRNDLKARLAYSTVSQLAYVTLGAALATTAGVMGGALHIAMHAAGKITLFFCAGAIYVAHHRTKVSELVGIGRLMPFTMTCFLIGSLSIIGVPPMGGTWSKWLLIMGALDAGYQFVVAVLLLSSLLSVGYLMPIVARAWFLPDGAAKPEPVSEAPLACLIPIGITAALCVLLFFFAGSLETLLQGMFQTPVVPE
jgi:multicomponent Na+:H+ antiporter subunit D